MYQIGERWVFELSEFDEAMDRLENDTFIGWDIETSNYRRARFRGDVADSIFPTAAIDDIAVVQLAGAPSGTVAVFHIRGNMPERLKELFRRTDITFAGHNIAAFDCPFLQYEGIDCVTGGQDWYDTLFGEWILLPYGRSNLGASLQQSLERRIGVKISKDTDHNWMRSELTPQQKRYAAEDVIYLYDLYREQQEQMHRRGLERAFELEMGTIPFFIQIHTAGVPIDPVALDAATEEAKEKLAEIKRELMEMGAPFVKEHCELCGREMRRERIPNTNTPDNNHKIRTQYRYLDCRYEWVCDNCGHRRLDPGLNLRSWKQKRDMWERLGIIDPKTGKPEHRTNTEAYSVWRTRFLQMRERNPKRYDFLIRFCNLMLDFSQYDTLVKVWGSDKFRAQIVELPDGSYRMFPSYRAIGTDTGRVSSRDPNLQQIPRRYRKLFGRTPGHKVVTADYSGIEVLVSAIKSRDETLLAALKTDDFHTTTASMIFGKPAVRLSTADGDLSEQDGITEEERTLAKGASFTLLFGGGWERIQDYAYENGTPLHSTEARAIFDGFFGAYRGLYRMREEAKRIAGTRQQYWLKQPHGLARLLTGRDLVYTRILNNTVQGTAAVGLKNGILKITKRYPEILKYAFSTVHDELDWIIPEDEVDEVTRKIEECMVEGMVEILAEDSGLDPSDIPVKVGITVGDVWEK